MHKIVSFFYSSNSSQKMLFSDTFFLFHSWETETIEKSTDDAETNVENEAIISWNNC